MPGENSGGGPDAGYTPPRPRQNPGGKARTRIKRRQTQAPRAPERKPQYRRPQPPSQPRRAPSGGGGGGGGVGSSYVTSNGAGGMSMTNDSPAAVPGINDFLSGDDTYQGQVAALTKALANYRSQMGERTDEYNQDFTRRLSDLNLTEQRNTEDQADDYAGRGMYISGLYGKARGDLERDFNNREGDMSLAKNQFLAGLNRDFTNFGEENNLSREKAKQDALNRRSLQYML